jgi:hypothetical protein
VTLKALTQSRLRAVRGMVLPSLVPKATRIALAVIEVTS